LLSSREIGLDIGLRIGRFFLKTEDLHYGYWEKGEYATIHNFIKAQEKHSDLIINNIPDKIKYILDVGSGSGNLALRLSQKGFNVDCVIPSRFLGEQVQKKLGNESKIYNCTFENLSIQNKFDLILFSESFQYVKLKFSLEKVSKLLNDGGYLLICDFFKKDIVEKSPLGGGHKWNTFNKLILKMKFEKIIDIDITKETAPTIDLMDQFNKEILIPLADMSGVYFSQKYPKLYKILKWKYNHKLKKINKIYLSGKVNGDCFKKFKTYRLLLYRKK